MTPEETARATAGDIGGLAAAFMLDPATYQRGGELGFEGLAFYVAGRAGVLGDVDADVAASAMTFLAPATVRTAWDQARTVLPPLESAKAFAACGHGWARGHLDEGAPCRRLAELAGAVVSAAGPEGSPIFAGWRQLPEPDDDRALALHRMNALRELRQGLHAAAVLAAGLTPLEAVVVRSPGMVALFGWTEPLPDPEPLRARWEEAEAATDRALARRLEVLTDEERDELVAVAAAVRAAVT